MSHLGLPPLIHPWIDSSNAPLYILRYPRDRTDEDVRQAHESIRVFYKKLQHSVAWIADASNVLVVPASQRKIIAEHKDAVRPYEERYNAGVALIMGSSILRGVFTAITWLAPVTHPYGFFADMATARSWALAQLEAAQLRPHL